VTRTLAVALVAGWLVAGSAQADGDLGRVPPIAARDLDGAAFSLDDALEQGPVVISFWATWCKPCRKELPEVQKILAAYKEKGFSVVAISADGPADEAKVRPYVRSQKFEFTVIPDPDGELQRRFQVEALPTTLLVTAEGMIVHRSVGYRRGDEILLENRVRFLLGLPELEPAADMD